MSAPVVGRLLEVAIAVADLDAAGERMVRLFDAPASHVIADPLFLMRFQMCRARTADFELMQGDPGTLIDRFVTGHGEGLHHIAFEVADATAALAACRERGLPVLSNELVLLDNLKAFFLAPHCLAGVLVEFIEGLHTWVDGRPLAAPDTPAADSSGAVEVSGFGVQVPDLDAAVSAFETVLGATAAPIVEDPARRFRTCSSRVANVAFKIVQMGGDAAAAAGAPRPRALHHVRLRARNLEQLAARLGREGVRFIEPAAQWRGEQGCLFTHPDDYHGVSFEITQA